MYDYISASLTVIKQTERLRTNATKHMNTSKLYSGVFILFLNYIEIHATSYMMENDAPDVVIYYNNPYYVE